MNTIHYTVPSPSLYTTKDGISEFYIHQMLGIGIHSGIAVSGRMPVLLGEFLTQLRDHDCGFLQGLIDDASKDCSITFRLENGDIIAPSEERPLIFHYIVHDPICLIDHILKSLRFIYQKEIRNKWLPHLNGLRRWMIQEGYYEDRFTFFKWIKAILTHQRPRYRLLKAWKDTSKEPRY